MIYFDNAATTRVSDTAAQAALTAMTELYANPSSAHAFGFEAEKALRAARAAVLAALGFTPSEGSLVFTGSGSEADNLALRGAAHALARRGRHIVLSDSEHPAVENTAKDLEKEGFTVSRISTESGKLDLERAREVLTPDTILVSCMAVNNETGAIYDIASLASLAKALCPNALFHTDAVQAFTKIPAGVWKKADLVSVSAHKIHAPNGVGALIVRKGVRLVPCITGGGQENGLRSGTEAMPGICAMAAAAKQATADFAALDAQVKSINAYLRTRLSTLDGVCINTEPDGFLPHILSIAVPGLRSEILLRFLSERGIYVSAGSACSAKHADNRVLSAFGLPDKIADSTLRLSFSADNTTAECDAFVKALSDAMQTLIHT